MLVVKIIHKTKYNMKLTKLHNEISKALIRCDESSYEPLALELGNEISKQKLQDKYLLDTHRLAILNLTKKFNKELNNLINN